MTAMTPDVHKTVQTTSFLTFFLLYVYVYRA